MIGFLKSKIVYFGFILFIIPQSLFALDEFENSLTVYSGAVVYADPQFDSVSQVEFPFSLNRNEFEFFHPEGEGEKLYTRIFAQIDIFNTFGTVIDSAKTYFSVRVNDKSESMKEGIKLFNKLILFLKPGIYSARLHVIDVVSKRSGEAFIDKIIVEPPEKHKISIGGPVFAFNIKKVVDSQSVNIRLVQNNFLITPNPVSMYSDLDSVICLYYELYNFDYNDSNSSKVQITYNILNNDTLYHTLGIKRIDKPGESAALAESFDIIGWPTELYQLQIIAKDLYTNVSDTCQKMFRILSSEEIALAVERFQSKDPYDDLDLEHKINMITYILDVQERQALSRLTDIGKENFLRQYWKDKTPKNRFGEIVTRKDLIALYKFANEYFSENEGKSDGWKTDRGRVLISYGQWDELENREVPMKQDSYEVWRYFGYREGKLFIFEDHRGYMRLVHSNVEGEVFSKKWNEVINSGMIDIDPDFVDEDDIISEE